MFRERLEAGRIVGFPDQPRKLVERPLGALTQARAATSFP